MNRVKTGSKKHFHFKEEYLALPGMLWIIFIIYLVIRLTAA
jgi:hypothetical protein